MSLLNKIFTAVRGGAREAGEAFVDANAVRICQEEIKQAEGQLNQAKKDLTEIMAKEMQAARKVKTLQDDVSKYEKFASQALSKNDEVLALEIAQKIADIQSNLEIEQKAQANFDGHANRLKSMIKKTETGLVSLQRQLVMVKTTESVQKANSAINNNFAAGSSSMVSAKESLDRIKQKQQDLEDRIQAGEALDAEFNGDDLEKKMKDAGILESDTKAQDILAQLKAKQ